MEYSSLRNLQVGGPNARRFVGLWGLAGFLSRTVFTALVASLLHVFSVLPASAFYVGTYAQQGLVNTFISLGTCTIETNLGSPEYARGPFQGPNVYTWAINSDVSIFIRLRLGSGAFKYAGGSYFSIDHDNPPLQTAGDGHPAIAADPITVADLVSCGLTNPAITVSNGADGDFFGSDTSMELQFSYDLDGLRFTETHKIEHINPRPYPYPEGDHTLNAASVEAYEAVAFGTFIRNVEDNGVDPTLSITANPTVRAVGDTACVEVTVNFSEFVTRDFADNLQFAGVVEDTLACSFGGGERFQSIDPTPLTPAGDVVLFVNGFRALYRPTGGDISFTASAGAGTDPYSNPTPAASLTIEEDATQPSVQILNAPAAHNGTDPFTVSIQFSEPVSGFLPSELTATNATVAGTFAIGGDGDALYTLLVTPTGSQDVSLNVASGVATDAVGLTSTAASQVTVTGDTVAPTATITSASSHIGTPFTATITFSEPVTGFLPSELLATNATVAGAFTTGTDGDTVYTVTITPTSTASIVLSLSGGVVQDIAGLVNVAATPFTVVGDTNAPTVAVTTSVSAHDGATPFTATVTFSEPVFGFSPSDIVATNATVASAFTSGADGATVYTITITPTATLNVTLGVAAGVAQDGAGLNNLVAAQATVSGDTDAPSVVITSAVASHDASTPFVVTITFSEPVTGFVPSEITVTNATLATTFSTGAHGASTYTLAVTPDGHLDVAIGLAANVAQDLSGNPNTAATSVIVTGTVVEQTTSRIQSFIQDRTGHILNNQPSLIGQVFSPGAGSLGPLGSLAINANPQSQTLFFATSRSTITGALASGQLLPRQRSMSAQERINAVFDIDQAPEQSTLMGYAPVSTQTGQATSAETTTATGAATEPATRAGAWDVWAEVYGSRSTVKSSESSQWVGFLGAHYFISNYTAVGVVAQLDWADEANAASGSSTEGSGWMVGPYLAGQIEGQNLFYEASIRYGQSENTISPIGTYSDRFDTSRWMVSAKVSGAYRFDSLTIRPEAGFSWYRETQESYVDSLNNPIPEATVSLGEFRFGPSFDWTTRLSNSAFLTLSSGINGVYNFDLNDNNVSQGQIVGADQLRARLSGGMSLALPSSGLSIDTDFFYDGIGIANYETYGGRARLTFRFH